MVTPSKKPKVARGSACPHCGHHAFEILKEDRRNGVMIYRCLNPECRGKVIT